LPIAGIGKLKSISECLKGLFAAHRDRPVWSSEFT
jgi:hypothetical protein